MARPRLRGPTHGRLRGRRPAQGRAGPEPSNVSSIASASLPVWSIINVTLANQNGEAAATGIVLTPTGEVLTNNHVIEGASAISATDVGNSKSYTATVVGYDRSQDIAVLQLTGASGLQTAKIGDPVHGGGRPGSGGHRQRRRRGGKPTAAGGSVIALEQQIVADGAGGSEGSPA